MAEHGTWGALMGEQKQTEELATKAALRDLYMARNIGVDVLAELERQGEVIDRMERTVDSMNSQLDIAKKRIKQLQSGFGFFTPKLERAVPNLEGKSPFDSSFDVCGKLWKLGGLFGNKWQQRWFFLVDTNLLYFLRESDATAGYKPRGVIALQGATVQLVQRSRCSVDYAFEIVQPKRTIMFHADDQRGARAWVAAMSERIVRTGGKVNEEVHAMLKDEMQRTPLRDGGAGGRGDARGFGSGAVAAPSHPPLDEFDRDMEEIGNVLGDLKGVARTMNTEIAVQGDQLGRLGSKLEATDIKLAYTEREVRKVK